MTARWTYTNTIPRKSRLGMLAALARAGKVGIVCKKKLQCKEIGGSHSFGPEEPRSMHMLVRVVPNYW